jgi:hypothetical protein
MDKIKKRVEDIDKTEDDPLDGGRYIDDVEG